MNWKIPPIIKVYEALGAIADNRVKLVSPELAKVTSSTGNKFYTVTFDKKSQIISANDNGSYWLGILGYPAISYLMITKILPFNADLSTRLKGIPWKEINQKNKNDFAKTEEYIYTIISQIELKPFAEKVINMIEKLHFKRPEVNLKPPVGW